MADLIEQSGGAKWAQDLRTQASGDTDDPLLPGGWRESWEWSRISGYLRRIDGRDRIRELSRLRLEYEDDCRKTFGEVVKLTTTSDSSGTLLIACRPLLSCSHTRLKPRRWQRQRQARLSRVRPQGDGELLLGGTLLDHAYVEGIRDVARRDRLVRS